MPGSRTKEPAVIQSGHSSPIPSQGLLISDIQNNPIFRKKGESCKQPPPPLSDIQNNPIFRKNEEINKQHPPQLSTKPLSSPKPATPPKPSISQKPSPSPKSPVSLQPAPENGILRSTKKTPASSAPASPVGFMLPEPESRWDGSPADQRTETLKLTMPETRRRSGLRKLAFWRWSCLSCKTKSSSPPPPDPARMAKRSKSFSKTILKKESVVKLPPQQLFQLEHESSWQVTQDLIALKQEGSYKGITKEEADALLIKYELGTYLLRPNNTCSGFCLSYVVSNDRIEHTDITREGDHETEVFKLPGQDNTPYKSLMEVVDMGRNSGFAIQISGSNMTFFFLNPPSDMALKDKVSPVDNMFR
ncbi:uncharacterized protein LOC134847764 isoform X2 [Symsagittifera roscoffensis]|uniref:uncharacterized protein LOC134847764 isoform X2 n=1 Tax=Symsagittifera roscoffensis TaxID=84072 RepID=UPI00307C6659